VLDLLSYGGSLVTYATATEVEAALAEIVGRLAQRQGKVFRLVISPSRWWRHR
jgi:hypothetical protein